MVVLLAVSAGDAFQAWFLPYWTHPLTSYELADGDAGWPASLVIDASNAPGNAMRFLNHAKGTLVVVEVFLPALFRV